VKNVGRQAMDHVVAFARPAGRRSIADFAAASIQSRNSGFESLVKGGAFDALHKNAGARSIHRTLFSSMPRATCAIATRAVDLSARAKAHAAHCRWYRRRLADP